MFNFFKDNKILVVIKRESQEKAYENAKNIIECGIKNIEITYNTPNAQEVIKRISNDFPDILVGAGTVMTAEQVKLACENKAKFIVSPGFIKEVSDECKKNKVLYIPGVITPTEICLATNEGWNFIKLFPSNFVGIKYIKALINGPFPKLDFIPTAGVSKENFNDWFAAGASAVGMSGKLLTDDVNCIKKEIKEILDNAK